MDKAMKKSMAAARTLRLAPRKIFGSSSGKAFVKRRTEVLFETDCVGSARRLSMPCMRRLRYLRCREVLPLNWHPLLLTDPAPSYHRYLATGAAKVLESLARKSRVAHEPR